MIDTDMAEQILQGDDTHPDILQALGLELLAEVKRLREQQKKISEIAETNMALEWGDTDCGAEWGYIIDLIKGWTE